MAYRRFSIASSRPGGVIGVSSGQAACIIERPWRSPPRDLWSACCASVGLTASSSLDRQVGHPGFCSRSSSLPAPLPAGWRCPSGFRPDRVEALLLLVAQRIVELLQRGLDRLHRERRRAAPSPSDVPEASSENVFRRARGLEGGGGVASRLAHIAEQLLLLVVEADLRSMSANGQAVTRCPAACTVAAPPHGSGASPAVRHSPPIVFRADFTPEHAVREIVMARTRSHRRSRKARTRSRTRRNRHRARTPGIPRHEVRAVAAPPSPVRRMSAAGSRREPRSEAACRAACCVTRG